MRHATSCWHFRAWVGLDLILMLLAAAGFGPARLAAQPPSKKNEEELKNPAKPKRHLRVDEPRAVGPTGLAGEAEQTTDPQLRKLYQDLAVPHDVLYFKGGRPRNVAPIPQFVGSPPSFKGPIEVVPYDDKWQPGTATHATADQLSGVDPYEHLALRAVDKLLAPDVKSTLPRLEQLRAAEKVLAAVVSFERSAHERGVRQGRDWQGLEKQVRDKLMTVQLEEVRLLVQSKNWEPAYDLATRLAETYPHVAEVQREVAQLLAQQAQESLQAKPPDYVTARLRLELLEAEFPNSLEARPIRERLRREAAELFRTAKELAENKKKPNEALAVLERAENIWPRLAGLHDYRLQLSNAYPTLLVGVKDLPLNLSPLTATTDSERQAVELLFEGLLKPGQELGVGPRYYPDLAVGRPALIPLGRKFELARDAYWSNGEQVTADDVQQTLKLLLSQGRASLIHEVRPGEDPFHLSISLDQGFLDPLSLMTFKVLSAAQLNDPKFSRQLTFKGLPTVRSNDLKVSEQLMGSGPFEYSGLQGEHVVFKANPNYRREGKAGLPHIREIHFLQATDAAADFAAVPRRLDLLLDLPTAVIRQVKTVPGVTVQTLRNRRIYFLAVNHRVPALQNQDLRRALANAIDRDRALRDFFRADLKEEPLPHRPLNGPYPPDSWACNPKPMPFDAGLAKQLADSARKAVGPTKLSLKYPAADSAVQKACEYIRDQVHGLGAGFELELEPRTPAQLREEVEVLHDYQLAYYHWDYPNDDYWLWPLFESSERALGAGGSNFLGYHNDPVLDSQLRHANAHRDFKAVQACTHTIHALIYEKMPFIPLWQLDTHIAYHEGLKPVRLDPLLIFPDVEEWTLEKR